MRSYLKQRSYLSLHAIPPVSDHFPFFTEALLYAAQNIAKTVPIRCLLCVCVCVFMLTTFGKNFTAVLFSVDCGENSPNSMHLTFTVASTVCGVCVCAIQSCLSTTTPNKPRVENGYFQHTPSTSTLWGESGGWGGAEGPSAPPFV